MRSLPIRSNPLNKTYIRFRARFILPVRWWLAKRRVAKNMLWPTRMQVIEMRDQLKTMITHNNTMDDLKSKEYNEGRISVLEWLIDGQMKDEV